MQGSLQLLRHDADRIAKTLIDHDIEILQDWPYEEHDRKHWNCRSNTDYPDSYSLTLLSWAAQVGHETAVRRPISTPHVDVIISENRLRRSLSWTAENEHETIVKLLLDNQTEIRFNDIESISHSRWHLKMDIGNWSFD
jgi:hypothetical protein